MNKFFGFPCFSEAKCVKNGTLHDTPDGMLPFASQEAPGRPQEAFLGPSWVILGPSFFFFFVYEPARCLEPPRPRRGARHRGPEVQAAFALAGTRPPSGALGANPGHGQADTAPTSAAGPSRRDQGLQFPRPPTRGGPLRVTHLGLSGTVQRACTNLCVAKT